MLELAQAILKYRKVLKVSFFDTALVVAAADKHDKIAKATETIVRNFSKHFTPRPCMDRVINVWFTELYWNKDGFNLIHWNENFLYKICDFNKPLNRSPAAEHTATTSVSENRYESVGNLINSHFLCLLNESEPTDDDFKRFVRCMTTDKLRKREIKNHPRPDHRKHSRTECLAPDLSDKKSGSKNERNLERLSGDTLRRSAFSGDSVLHVVPKKTKTQTQPDMGSSCKSCHLSI